MTFNHLSRVNGELHRDPVMPIVLRVHMTIPLFLAQTATV